MAGGGTGKRARIWEQGSGQPIGAFASQPSPFSFLLLAVRRFAWRGMEGKTDLTNPRPWPVINYNGSWAIFNVLSPDLLTSYFAQSGLVPAPRPQRSP